MVATMAGNFIEHRDSGYYSVGSRVPIDRIVREYRDGEQPEAIRSHYPTLSLEQVNGAIAFYLNHKEEVEGHGGAGARRGPVQKVPRDASRPKGEDSARATATAGATKLIRFLADADLDDAIVSGCRRREPVIDFLSVERRQSRRRSGPDAPSLGRRAGSHSCITRFPDHAAALWRVPRCLRSQPRRVPGHQSSFSKTLR
jgi:hypothetical protein